MAGPSTSSLLVIDDDLDSLFIVAAYLRGCGYEVFEASDSDVGIQLAREHLPALILLDMYMPGRNGWETAEALKACVETRDIPVVALTAMHLEAGESELRERGFAGLLAKPFEAEDLVRLIERFVPRARAPHAAP